MKSFKIVIYIVLGILVTPFCAKSQINDSLLLLCNSIEVLNDTSDISFKHVLRSRKYEIQMLNDSLCIEIIEIDESIWSTENQEIRVDTTNYRINKNDIAQIKFLTEEKELYDYKWTEAWIQITALRYYPLFDYKINNSKTFKTDEIKIRVVNLKKSIFFENIASLLRNNIDLESNYIDASCKLENVTISDNDLILNSIEENNLEVSMEINGNNDLEEEVSKILSDYLSVNNIKKIFGTIFIDDMNQFRHFYNEQNEMYNYLNTLDTIPAAYRVMRETAYFKITDEQVAEMSELFLKQDWKSGICDELKVNSHFDFHIENNEYKE